MVIAQNGEATLVVMGIKSFKAQENTLALLKILTLSSREVALGQYRDAEEVFADMDRLDKP